jgi:hypothetical protein
MSILKRLKTIRISTALPDIFAAAGLIFIWTGLSQYDIIIAETTVGAIFLILGIIGGLKK